ncbi:photosynthetiC reaction center cytochrome c subunit [Luminiphilus syltensis NOR5-1B]|uniref:Photosynthetic reaction center cytochrome c subunit n=1 Tax=Luminiphilus syltensis NOR5-1B TaxID=565045 RepID=B8KT28_9GAMM|nr:photosynthetic reaction center cytochrome PufC [Luminiphilus syltensis]EED36005.1 photosynthetiC reaction center cytochrome c subunit [Luminiphilus syltensis NOR5-1B]
MKMNKLLRSSALVVTLGSVFIAGCEQPDGETVQLGYRGTGMEAVYNPDTLQAKIDANQVPDPQPKVPTTGPKARDIYQNVQVLGDLSVGEFTRLMAAMTEWVSPEEGCNYCHNAADFADDAPYTKRVARVMIGMTQRANEKWQPHVGDTGVTCYTCHRGKNIPEYVWSTDPGHPHAKGIASAQQNIASASVGYSSLPYDPFTPFLEDNAEIRNASDTALPTGNRTSIKQTEWTYSLMMHFSDSLGVNCTYCHNSRAFASWEQSSPARTTAWHGIRMVRELNNDFINSTTSYLPDNRKGPLGDPLKVSCETCHQGAYKPLYGAPMLKDYPNLSSLDEAATAQYLKAALSE